MNTSQVPSEMDIHFKDGLLRCKYCKKTVQLKWPATLADMLPGGYLAVGFEKFQKEHTTCAWNAQGHMSLS